MGKARLAALTSRGEGVPAVAGIVSDGQATIRRAVAEVFPGVSHLLCQFHDLREAARPVAEADRHAKKELKKAIRGVRAIERSAESETDGASAVVRAYCAAVRGALDAPGASTLVRAGADLAPASRPDRRQPPGATPSVRPVAS